MISISGNRAVVADSDALVGLMYENDALNSRCIKISEFLFKNNFRAIISGPVLLEAATVLARDKTIKRPDLAKKLLQDYGTLEFPNLDQEAFVQLAKHYNPRTSKRNTPFDFFVAATAKTQGIQVIFSFDEFYKKQGFLLAEELLSTTR